jgi:antibiotic biosynthesis monooxygenase (ABM) superfamily enzyme
MVLQPHQDKSRWFGLFRFRSPLLTESILFIFLRLLRCFTSPRVTSTTLFIQMVTTPYKRCQVSLFGYFRIKAYLPLPETFRSLLRPSSSVDAKAFADGCNWFMQTLIF